MDPITMSAIIGGGASIFGSLFSAKSQAQTNKANAAQAQSQMDFQERMSNTAHTREVADLKNAGLNPILSANGGASTPGGAMANFQNPYANLPHDLSNSASNLTATALAKAQIATQASQQVLNLSSASNQAAQAKYAGGNISIPGMGSVNVKGAVDAIGAQMHSAKSWFDKIKGKFSNYKASQPAAVSGARG